MWTQNKILYIILAACLGYIVFLQQCRSPEPIDEPEPIIITLDSIQYIKQDSIIVDTFYTPEITNTIVDTFIYYADVDTAEILKNYFSKKVVVDTILSDSATFFCITDTLSQNTIVSRSYRFSQLPRVKVIHLKELIEPQITISAGAEVGGNLDRFGFAPSVLIGRKNNTYSISYDLINKEVRFGIYWRIFRK